MRVDVAIAQFRPAKADPAATLEGIADALGRAAAIEPRPRLVVFPEAALTGYFLEGGVREHALPATDLFAALSDAWTEVGDGEGIDIALGFYELAERRVYNSGLYARLGGPAPGIVHVHRKVFLPTYGVFQEERFVEAGGEVRAFDAGWGRCAMLVCEDAFHSIGPTLAALDGAEVLLVLSASPARGTGSGRGMPGNLERWDALGRQIASEHGIYLVISQLVGFEGGKGFAGGSAAYSPRGRPLIRGELWSPGLLPVSLDMEELVWARGEAPLLADLERMWPRLMSAARGSGGPVAEPPASGPVRSRPDPPPTPAAGPVGEPEPERTGGEDAGRRSDVRPAAVRRPGPDPEDLSPLEIDEGLVEDWLLEFLREEIRGRRGFERAVVGISGGVDSSVTATLCARALGPEAVTGLLLPYRTSSEASRTHALELAEGLGIETRTIDITDAVDGYLGQLDADPGGHRTGNVAARQRMIAIFDQAAALDALPVGTGNKSERLLGYFTWHADDSPPINPLGDLFKIQVWALARHLGVPEEIVEKPATADLIRGQTDEGDLGISYPEADLILHHLISGWSPRRLVERGFDPGKIEIVRERLEGTHWKRNLPTVAVLSDTAIGEWYLRPVDY